MKSMKEPRWAITPNEVLCVARASPGFLADFFTNISPPLCAAAAHTR